jgi:hypothetical protein
VGETPRELGAGQWREQADEEARSNAERSTTELPPKPNQRGGGGR